MPHGPTQRENKDDWAEMENGLRYRFSNFICKDLSLKIKVSNTFKPNLNGGHTKVNLNKLFEDFPNLELLKIKV